MIELDGNELLKSEQLFRMIFDNAPLGIVYFDPNGVILDCNRYFLEIMGSGRDSVIGFSMVDSALDESMRSAVHDVLGGKTGYSETDRISVTGNKLTPLRTMFNRVLSRTGEFVGVVGTFLLMENFSGGKATEEPDNYRKRLEILVAEKTSDLRKTNQLLQLETSERKRVNQAMEKANLHLQEIIDFLPDATFVIDRDGKVILWNRAIEEMTGVSKAEIRGKGNYAYAIPFYGKRRPLLVDMVMDAGTNCEPLYSFVERKGNTILAEAFVPELNGGLGAHLWGTASLLFDGEKNCNRGSAVHPGHFRPKKGRRGPAA